MGEPVYAHGFLRHIRATPGYSGTKVSFEPERYDYDNVASDLVTRGFKFVEVLQDGMLTGSQFEQQQEFQRNGDTFVRILDQSPEKKYFRYFLTDVGDERCQVYEKRVGDYELLLRKIRRIGVPPYLCIATEKSATSEAEYVWAFDLKRPQNPEKYPYSFYWRHLSIEKAGSGDTIALIKDFSVGTSGDGSVVIFSCSTPEAQVEKINKRLILASKAPYRGFASERVRRFYDELPRLNIQEVSQAEFPAAEVLRPALEEMPVLEPRKNELPTVAASAHGTLYLENELGKVVLINRLNDVPQKLYLPARVDYPDRDDLQAIVFAKTSALLLTPVEMDGSFKILVTDIKNAAISKSYNVILPLKPQKRSRRDHFIESADFVDGKLHVSLIQVVPRDHWYDVVNRYSVNLAVDAH